MATGSSMSCGIQQRSQLCNGLWQVNPPTIMVVLWENHRKTIGKWWLYPLVNIQKTMENHHAINGKINYFDWAIFNSFLYVYQRLELISQLMGAARAMFYPGSPPRQCPGGATSHACSRPDVALPEYPHGKTTGKSKIYRFFMVFHHSICSIFRVNLCFKSGMIHLQFDA